MDTIHHRCLEFIGSKVQELIQHGISVHLTNKRVINNKYSGTFDAARNSLTVAMGQGSFSVYTFLHEYAHFIQHRDKTELWNYLHEEGTYKYINWLNRSIVLSKPEIELAFRNTLALEHDAETMALSMVLTHNLPLDIAAISRCANNNLLFYSWTRIRRDWNNGFTGVCDTILEQQLPAVLQPLDYFTDMKNTKNIFKKAGVRIGQHTRYY